MVAYLVLKYMVKSWKQNLKHGITLLYLRMQLRGRAGLFQSSGRDFKIHHALTMAYIYCITNLINNKRYIGKTTLSIQERFKEHCKDSKRKRFEKRPLYDAMSKYGVENFIIEELEQVEDESILSEREIYWIQELQTYGRNGYNATKGGDGKILYDYNEILELIQLGYSYQQVCDKVNCSKDVVYKVCRSHGIKGRSDITKLIAQYDKAGNYIQTFWGTSDALSWLNSHGIDVKSAGQITRVCRNEQSSAHNYIWKYIEEPIL